MHQGLGVGKIWCESTISLDISIEIQQVLKHNDESQIVIWRQQWNAEDTCPHNRRLTNLLMDHLCHKLGARLN
jgi:hypothetical protein